MAAERTKSVWVGRDDTTRRCRSRTLKTKLFSSVTSLEMLVNTLWKVLMVRLIE